MSLEDCSSKLRAQDSIDSLDELLQRVVLAWHDELVEVDEGDVREAIHGAVETVVECSEETLGTDLCL